MEPRLGRGIACEGFSQGISVCARARLLHTELGKEVVRLKLLLELVILLPALCGDRLSVVRFSERQGHVSGALGGVNFLELEEVLGGRQTRCF